MMTEKETPNYYAVIPAPVRYADDLSEFQKLLYGEITALAQKDGYCYASNNYFSSLYGKGKDWISKSINKMQELGYLKIEHDKEAGNLRKIFIGELVKLKGNIKAPIGEKSNRGYSRKVQPPIIEKSNTPIGENSNHNNINNNNTSVIGENTQPTHKNIEYINGMRSVELKGKQYLWAWNELTGDSSVMSSDVKKGIYNIQNSITADDFKARVEKFAVIKDLIVRKSMQNYFYYRIWDWTLEDFLGNINKFYGEDSIIVSRLAKKEEVKKALRVLEVQTTQQQPVYQPKEEMTEEQKQEAREQIKKMRQSLLTKTA